MPIKYDTSLKRPNKKINFTTEQVQDLIQCSKDPIYFAEKFYTIVTGDGAQKIKLYGYQKKLLKAFQDNRFNILLSSRQSGKCVHTDTNIIIKHKISGEEKVIAIGDFFNIILYGIK